MRWDNPIYCKWLELPDVASLYPEEKQNRLDDDYDPWILDVAVTRGDEHSFMEEIRFAMHGLDDPALFDRIRKQFRVYRNNMVRPPHSNHEMILTREPANSVFQSIYNNGIWMGQVDTSKINVGKLVDKWLAKPDWQPPPGTYDRGEMLGAEYIKTLQAELTKRGILEAASAYKGKPLKVAGAYLHISTPTDQHYRQFGGYDAPVNPWINTHIDPKEDCMKAIIYLEGIEINNGPFHFIEGSHRFVIPAHKEILGRALCTGNYMQTPEERAPILAMPKPLRVSYNFGRFVEENSVLSQEMLLFRRTLLSAAETNIAVFDAGAGIHQGGVVEKGRRVNLQVLMK